MNDRCYYETAFEYLMEEAKNTLTHDEVMRFIDTLYMMLQDYEDVIIQDYEEV